MEHKEKDISDMLPRKKSARGGRNKIIETIESEPVIIFENSDIQPNIIKPSMSKVQKLKSLINKKNIFIALFVVLAVGFGYYFMQYRKVTKDPKQVAKEKTAEVIKQISALALVPTDPNAVLANVTDITKLAGQPFFADAQNGDEIVIFPSAMRAILYRPSINKIINIGPLSSQGAATGTTPAPTPKPATTPTPTPKPTTPVKKP